jgi:hypothetical protein
MSKLTNSWSVKGVSEEARALAKQAAADSGISLGQWMNQTLIQQASQKSTPKTAMAPGTVSAPEAALSPSELQKVIAVMDNKLQRLESKMQNDLTILHRQLCRMEDRVNEDILANHDAFDLEADNKIPSATKMADGSVQLTRPTLS